MIHAEAEAEVRAAIAYYQGQREGLGREFRREFEATLERLRRTPEAFVSIDDRGTRKHRFRRFPYTIYYVELDDSIWIAAVAHQKRRPGYWSGREPQRGGDA
jgi:toxin ParE1/3/4